MSDVLIAHRPGCAIRAEIYPRFRHDFDGPVDLIDNPVPRHCTHPIIRTEKIGHIVPTWVSCCLNCKAIGPESDYRHLAIGGLKALWKQDSER